LFLEAQRVWGYSGDGIPGSRSRRRIPELGFPPRRAGAADGDHQVPHFVNFGRYFVNPDRYFVNPDRYFVNPTSLQIRHFVNPVYKFNPRLSHPVWRPHSGSNVCTGPMNTSGRRSALGRESAGSGRWYYGTAKLLVR